MKVSEQAVQDLIDLIDYTPYGTVKVLETLYEILPWIEIGNEEIAIKAGVEAETLRGSIHSKAGVTYQVEFIQRCILELDNYIDKRAVIEAAIIKVEDDPSSCK